MKGITFMEIRNKNTSAFDHLTTICYRYESPTEDYHEALDMAIRGLHVHKKEYKKSSKAIILKHADLYEVLIIKK